MKKIISCTLAASIAGTSISTVKPVSVKATDKDLNISESDVQDAVNVEIENTEKIDDESTGEETNKEETNINDSVQDDSSEESLKGEASEENADKDSSADDDSKENADESTSDNENTSDEETSKENTDENAADNEGASAEDSLTEEVEEDADIQDIDGENSDILDAQNNTSSNPVIKGKLELDMNFVMPLVDSDNLDLTIELSHGNDIVKRVDLSKNSTNVSSKKSKAVKLKDKNSKLDSDLDANLDAGLDSEITYKLEKYNFKRQLISEDSENESIYYIKITFEGLEKGIYSLNVLGSGYVETSIDDIDLTDYSKRVKLASSESKTGYNTVFLAGDVNEDKTIDMDDYQIVFEKIGKKISGNDLKKYDLNRDGKIDIADLSIIHENIGKSQENVTIEDTDKIIDVNHINMSSNAVLSGSTISDILVDDNSSVQLSLADGEGPSTENPISLSFDLSGAINRRRSSGIEMEQIVIKSPEDTDDAGAPSAGFITYEDEDGNTHEVEFGNEDIDSHSSESDDLVIDLGTQVAVKQISINVTANRGNKNISQIAKIEFLNNVYKELPKPDMNIPVIKTVETSTEMHDERITISWEPEANVTSYEVKYEKLNENGQSVKTKTLQTNKTELNILDKDIKPYDIYRVSVQALNGEWASGYEEKSDDHPGYDGKPDNVDENFVPSEDYYNGDKGSVTEIQVIPLRLPEVPRNLTTIPGYKSFTVSWEDHRQARDFDVYYRKVGDSQWIKANKELVRAHTYTIPDLEDETTYEVSVTATNHFGTSGMSEIYIASTTSLKEPTVPQYKLINKKTSDNEIGTSHIVNVRNKIDADGWDPSDKNLTVDTQNAVVDGDFSTALKCNDWDMGAYYGADRGSEITFDKEYEIGKVILTKAYQGGYDGYFVRVKVTYWDENGNKNSTFTESIETRTSNGQQYHIAKLDKPIKAKKIKVDTGGGGWQTISELMFYEYDSIEDDIKALYTDSLRVELKPGVIQEDIDKLYERANTKDAESGEYHPERTTILKELDNAQKLLNDKEVSTKITTLDAAIRTDNIGPSLGMENSYQSLGAVARPNGEKAQEKDRITVYMGSSDPNTRVDIVFLQNYGLPGSYQSKVYTISPGVTDIEIPTIISADVEKGGQVMARVTQGSTTADIKIRLSGVEEITRLNVNNMINDKSKVAETKQVIRTYIQELKKYVNELPGKYPSEVSSTDKIDNIYKYDEQTSVLNTTDIEGDRFTLTLPATEILKGITSGLNGDEDKEVERVYEALLAWEQQIQVGYAKKGVFEEVKDFNGDGVIDSSDNDYFNANKAPLTRLNVKYQRMMMGAAAYASSHHIGVGFSSSSYIQGVPYKFDENGEVINSDEARLYGPLMGHEIGHAMDISERLYPETSNNLMASITSTMLDEDNPKTTSEIKALYEKVTSNTIGLSTNRNVVLGMLWQPYLAYEDDSTYKMLLKNFDGDISDDSYFAKLNRAYREMTAEEKANGDRDQYLIRLTSKVAGKNLANFYLAHGIVPNETTLAYVSKFQEETRPVQYINDEARRKRMDGTADMQEGTKLNANFGADSKGNKIKAGSYVNSKEIKIELSVDKSEENILGYEIYRNGLPCGFIERDKNNSVTVYTDIVDNINNMVTEYKAVAYDYNLNATNEVELGAVKVRHDGGIAKNSIEITSNTISLNEEHNDIHAGCANEDLKHALDDDNSTHYEGRMLEKNEYNSSIHESQMAPGNDPYIILDTTELKTLVGIKYTAPVEEKGFIFKKADLAEGTLDKYKIEVSRDGVNWTKAKEGKLNISADNPKETIYFDAEGVEGGKQLNSYNARYVKITALGTKNISAAELELITPPGDNIEIGVSTDEINYINGIGLLKEDYVYQKDNPETNDVDEFRKIPAGSVIITGEYRGNPAFNVPLVLNQNEEHIADKYNGLLFAEIPDNGDLEEISKGNWVYWVEPEYVEQFKKENEKVFAELYRTDAADASEGGQRLVSDTFRIDVPETLPQISLSKVSGYRAADNLKTIEINKDLIENINKNR